MSRRLQSNGAGPGIESFGATHTYGRGAGPSEILHVNRSNSSSSMSATSLSTSLETSDNGSGLKAEAESGVAMADLSLDASVTLLRQVESQIAVFYDTLAAAKKEAANADFCGYRTATNYDEWLESRLREYEVQKVNLNRSYINFVLFAT